MNEEVYIVFKESGSYDSYNREVVSIWTESALAQNEVERLKKENDEVVGSKPPYPKRYIESNKCAPEERLQYWDWERRVMHAKDHVYFEYESFLLNLPHVL